MSKRKYTTITIPAALFDKIEKQIQKTGFSSVSDYSTYILREITAELEGRKKGRVDVGGREGGRVVAKLSALGYV
jgi:Arc/MetJ-type ribon-helix-helix transcriptional regulator